MLRDQGIRQMWAEVRDRGRDQIAAIGRSEQSTTIPRVHTRLAVGRRREPLKEVFLDTALLRLTPTHDGPIRKF